MSSLTHRVAVSAPSARTVALAALLGATMLVSPLTAARADSAVAAQLQPAQATPRQAAAEATEAKAETVEQRITNLRAELKITPDEESKWTNVAQAMRENAAAMQKLAAEKTTHPAQNMTAVQDLKNYEKYAQAHVDGLKNLIASFETLYKAMPESQKKIADEVFQTFGHKGESPHG